MARVGTRRVRCVCRVPRRNYNSIIIGISIQLVNEEGLPIVDISEPVTAGDFAFRPDPASTFDDPDVLPLWTLSDEEKARRKAERERILDLLLACICLPLLRLEGLRVDVLASLACLPAYLWLYKYFFYFLHSAYAYHCDGDVSEMRSRREEEGVEERRRKHVEAPITETKRACQNLESKIRLD